MNDDWAALVRQCLARRDSTLLKQAIAAAWDQEVIHMLEALQAGDFDTVNDLAETFRDSLQLTGYNEEILTVALIQTDLQARLAEFYNQLPLEQQAQGLQMGIEACEEGIRLATILNDQPCIALYTYLKGIGSYHARDLDTARVAFEKALSLYRHLEQRHPGVYSFYVAGTVNNLGGVLKALGELAASRRMYEESLILRRRFAQTRPRVYEPLVAETLSNLTSVLAQMREFTAARERGEEGLAVCRRLASIQPHEYEPHLAAMLSNLGSLLGELRELELARDAFEEALALYRGFARGHSQVYLPDVARTLSNLGNTLFYLKELAVALKRYEEALTLYRRLAQDQPLAYLPCVADALGGLGNVLMEQKQFAAALNQYEEALDLWRSLDRKLPQVYEPEVAEALHNLGNLLLDMQDLTMAQKAYEEALSIRRNLAHRLPQIYQPSVAATLDGIGNVLRDLGKFAAAQRTYEESLGLRRRLAKDLPQVYDVDLAITLNNLGNMLCEQQELEEARERYKESLSICWRLAQKQPQIYEPKVADRLNNLGTVLRDLREWGAAQTAFEEAVVLYEKYGLWLESAVTYYNWGLLAESEGEVARAMELFEESVKRCERGLDHLTERAHRDLFKGKIEYAYTRLIEHCARLAQTDGYVSRERLVGLLESLRQVEALAGFGEALRQRDAGWRESFSDMVSGKGQLSNLFRQERCALLFVHVTKNNVVFIILIPGACWVDIAERVVGEKLWELFIKVEQAMKSHQSRDIILEKAISVTRSAIANDISSTGEMVYSYLPERVKSLLTGDEFKTVFLAPCRATVNLPFEMICVPKMGYVGLQRLIPRIHGLGELINVLKRQPSKMCSEPHLLKHLGAKTRGINNKGKRVNEKRAVVVGNPLHLGAAPLPYAHAAAKELAGRLHQRGFHLAPRGHALLDGEATTEALEKALGGTFVLWVQMGHGGRVADDRYLYLALAGEGELPPQWIVRQQWEHHPVIHYDCCFIGSAQARGGGRFDGHTTAALLAGASCVLSSVHALWDAVAAEFSKQLYEKALDTDTPLPLGVALLEARQEIARKYDGNPLFWATTVLWGNPWARLV